MAGAPNRQRRGVLHGADVRQTTLIRRIRWVGSRGLKAFRPWRTCTPATSIVDPGRGLGTRQNVRADCRTPQRTPWKVFYPTAVTPPALDTNGADDVQPDVLRGLGSVPCGRYCSVGGLAGVWRDAGRRAAGRLRAGLPTSLVRDGSVRSQRGFQGAFELAPQGAQAVAKGLFAFAVAMLQIQVLVCDAECG